WRETRLASTTAPSVDRHRVATRGSEVRAAHLGGEEAGGEAYDGARGRDDARGARRTDAGGEPQRIAERGRQAARRVGTLVAFLGAGDRDREHRRRMPRVVASGPHHVLPALEEPRGAIGAGERYEVVHGDAGSAADGREEVHRAAVDLSRAVGEPFDV